MILSGQTIRQMQIMDPFCERTKHNGMSYGLSSAGYDVRVAQDILLQPGGFSLGSTIEKFTMPNNVIAVVHDKSTWARRGLSMFNTVIEPGWTGYLTLELVNEGSDTLVIMAGDPIAQILFQLTDQMVENPYSGKYNNQANRPVKAIYEQEE